MKTKKKSKKKKSLAHLSKVYKYNDKCNISCYLTSVRKEYGLSLLNNKINIEHACELSCACTTCHVIVTNGFEKLNEASEEEEDLLDKAWGLEQRSRLSCQIILDEEDLEIEIPKYNINMVSENPH